MLTRRTYWLCLGIALALVFIAWTGLVPQRMSASTFAWLTVVAIALGVVSLLTMKAGQPTSSLAQARYDAEQRDRIR